MSKEKKSGLFGKFFAPKKSSCCSVEIEEVDETASDSSEKIPENTPEKKEENKNCCGCGC